MLPLMLTLFTIKRRDGKDDSIDRSGYLHTAFEGHRRGRCEPVKQLDLVPAQRAVAALSLAMLLVTLFRANIRAAREHLTIGGRPATALPLRTLLQLVFIVAVLVAGFPGAFPFIAR
jgi:hypothetical protein